MHLPCVTFDLIFFFLSFFAIPAPVILQFLPPHVAGGDFGVDVDDAFEDTRSCVVFLVPVQVGLMFEGMHVESGLCALN